MAIVTFGLGRNTDALALCRRARALAGRLEAMSPALLLPVVELEANIAGERRDPAATALADEAAELARAAFGPDSPRTTLALLQPHVHHDTDPPGLTANLDRLADSDSSMWATALIARLETLTTAGQPTRTLNLLAQARTMPTWSRLSSESHVAMMLIAADAQLASDLPTLAAASLDEAESLAGASMPRSARQYLDYHRGRIALRTGDPATAVTILRRAVASYATTYDSDHPEFLAVQSALVRALRAAGHRPEADTLAAALTGSYQQLGPAFAREAATLAP